MRIGNYGATARRGAVRFDLEGVKLASLLLKIDHEAHDSDEDGSQLTVGCDTVR